MRRNPWSIEDFFDDFQGLQRTYFPDGQVKSDRKKRLRAERERLQSLNSFRSFRLQRVENGMKRSERF